MGLDGLPPFKRSRLLHHSPLVPPRACRPRVCGWYKVGVTQDSRYTRAESVSTRGQ